MTHKRIYLALAAVALLAVILIAVFGCTGAAPTAAVDELELADKERPPSTEIIITGDLPALPAGPVGQWLFRLPFHTVAAADLTPRPSDGVIGNGRYVGVDRTGYNTAWVHWLHEDPGHHPFLTAIRVVVQSYHPPMTQGLETRIDDRGICESSDPCGQALGLPPAAPPYPYEPGSVLPVDCSRPGATFEFLHVRATGTIPPDKSGEDPTNDKVPDQLLARFVLPATSPDNPKVHWCYELGGLAVAHHEDDINGDGHKPDQVARIFVNGLHPSYTIRVSGVFTSHGTWVEVL